MSNKKWIVLTFTLLISAFLVVTTLAGAPAPSSPGGPETMQAALGSGFTYQGRLNDVDGLVSDNCDMAFRLYDQAAAGSQIGSPISLTVPISNGLFTVVVNDGGQFGGSAFDGNARWLDIKVKCPADLLFTDLGRQQLTSVPYAQYSLSAPWDGLSGVPAGFADNIDDDTTYSVGSGLVMTGTQMGVDWTAVAASPHTHYSLVAADGDPTNAVYVDVDGHVGIGTTNPDATLKIGDYSVGESTPMVFVWGPSGNNRTFTGLTPDRAAYATYNYNGGNGTRYGIGQVSGGLGLIGYEGTSPTASYGNIQFFTGNYFNASAERMRIRYDGNVGIGTTSPQSTLQVGGYIQLDTLTAAPPAADCDETSERGRMKVDIANDLLYICTNSGWISK